MAVVLDQPAIALGDPEAARVPAGLRVVPFSDGMAVALHAAETEAMADHFGYEPRGFDSWAGLALQDAFRPDLTRLALDGDEVAGYVRVADERGDRVRISAVGTRPRWRGRGLASALLRQALAAAAADGGHRATLGVDSQNPTGAVGIYQRTGFEVVSSWVSYRKPLS
jgi:ribosomal protein S18 acetylase RimI-like enzyme